MPLTSSLQRVGGNFQSPGINPRIGQPVQSFSTQVQPTGMANPQQGFSPPPQNLQVAPQVNPQTPGINPGINNGTVLPQNPNVRGGVRTPIIPPPPGISTQPPTGGIVPDGFTPPNQPTPQFGLAGAEAAFAGGAGAGVNALQSGANQGINTLLGGFAQAQQSLQQGRNLLGGGFGSGAGQSTAGQGSASNVDPLTGRPLFEQAAQGVGEFAAGGAQAQQRVLALTGALGPEAQQQAQQGFIDSPGQRFAREQALTDISNAAGAGGSRGSGQFFKELQERGLGLSAQNQQQNIQNLLAGAGQGLNAAQAQGQFLGQAAGQEGQLASQNAAQQTQTSLQNAAARTQSSIANAGNVTQAGISSARNQLSAAQTAAGLSGQEASLAAALAGQGAGFQFGAGQGASNLLAGAANQIGGTRFQAGQDIAGQIANTTGGLSNLQNQGGLVLSDLLGGFAGNAANQVSGAGQFTAQQQQQLAQILSQLATGEGGQLAGFQNLIGQAQAGGLIGSAGAVSGTVGDIATGLGLGVG